MMLVFVAPVRPASRGSPGALCWLSPMPHPGGAGHGLVVTMTYTTRGGGGGLTRKRYIPPRPAQPRHTNYWAPRTRKQHQQEHRPQRPTGSSALAPRAEGRTGDCPGPHKETTTAGNPRLPGPK